MYSTFILCFFKYFKSQVQQQQQQPFYGSVEFVRENPGEPVPEEHSPTTKSQVLNTILQSIKYESQSLYLFLCLPHCLSHSFTLGLQSNHFPIPFHRKHFPSPRLTPQTITRTIFSWVILVFVLHLLFPLIFLFPFSTIDQSVCQIFGKLQILHFLSLYSK